MKTALRILSAGAVALCMLVLGAVLDGVKRVNEQPAPVATIPSQGRTLHASTTEPARRPHPSVLVATTEERR